ncbi:MAG TPA: GGDEF domain-containing protein [Pseudonocardia sp.]|nr:GGDEF domain-containing protein [Pseudonocardia sp.]
MPLRRDDPLRITRWSVWAVPRSVLSVIFLVELLAVVLLAVGGLHGGRPVDEHMVLSMAVLAVAGVLSSEASLGVERIRRQTDESPHIDLSSVWNFAAAVLLPPVLAGVIVAIIYGHLYLRIWRQHGVPPHRVLFSTATVVLAVQAAGAIIGHGGGGPDPFHTLTGLLSLVVAVFAYAVVNMALIVTVIVLSAPHRNWATVRQVLGLGHDTVLEFATLAMGALTAAAMATFGPLYAVLVLPPLIVLHRTVLVRQLEEEASIDGKTGLLNSVAWHIEADRVVQRIARFEGNATVLLIDLDNFKQVNDRHGHLVGDQVLIAVAKTIGGAVRDDDLVGRFGGEEFVVLMPAPDGDPGRAGAEAAAHRIRRRIEQLEIVVPAAAGEIVVSELSVSIGGATSPADGSDLPALLKVADAAMYAAKNAGRNRVFMGQHSIRPAGGAESAPADG